jgi:beta-galactosidase
MKLIHKTHSLVLVLLVGTPLAIGCNITNSPGTQNTGGGQAGGAGAGGNTVNVGGTTSAGGQVDTGGIPIPSAGDTGGSIITGGDTVSGGAGASGGETVVGGSAAGGNTVAGGSTGVVGGTTKAGGNTAPGGTTAVGGTKAPGGTTTASGGVVVTGGTTGGGGVTVLPPITGRVRTIMPLDRNWLFNKGDVTGADGASLPADSTWRKVNLPHDWAIEGPFDSAAATTGRGAYVPSGIGWYRNHFTLPTTVTSGRQVYVEFDGVMGNSTIYLNGTQLGNHPYGYVSFRYDATKSIKFGAENVIAVKTDTSIQPASRFYAGAGIYRRVRVIATDPVHIDQYATYVQTPAPTTTSATVQVSTSVVNSGTASASVSVQGIVSDAAGTALAPVSAAAQTIAAGASASFTFSVPVANPKLWDLANPNMYQLLTNVVVGGTTVDDDVTPFGIREIKFSTGMTINGKSVKFQGVCNHQDFHGLGLAAPQRAMQRRLAQLKAIGVNAIRTAHDPPSPEFLDLTDRMGMLVLDEFTDVWGAQKYQDKGDYAMYFNKAPTNPTGMPALPSSATGTASWWKVDFTGWIMRDRNHPSVALYSVGNEIHDGIGTRTPILTIMVAMSHQLDPSRSVTQALLQPKAGVDIGGATNTLLDVWGDNYHVDSALTAMVSAPTKSGLITEMGTETSTWSQVTANAGLTGEFMWTGVDYMGERDGGWPSIGGNGGLMDDLGAVKPLGYQWSAIWGGPSKSAPPSGAKAGQVVLTADHPTLTTDVDDVSFVKAEVSGTSAVTFAITGPGTIVAVDSGSMTQESFRGTSRNAFSGVAYAIVQATGAGTITVTATSSGLTAGTATITATEGTFVPCSGTCN